MTIADGSARSTRAPLTWKGGKTSSRRLGFLFLAHADPGIGVNHVHALNRSLWIVSLVEGGPALLRHLFRHGQGAGGQGIALWGGDGEIDSQAHAGEGQETATLLPSPMKVIFEALELAKAFQDGEHIGHGLAGWLKSLRPLMTGTLEKRASSKNVLMFENTGHDDLDVTREHAADVGNGLALAEADFAGGEIQSVAAQVAHGHVERHPGPQAGLLEHHRQDLVLEDGRIAPMAPFVFHSDGQG